MKKFLMTTLLVTSTAMISTSASALTQQYSSSVIIVEPLKLTSITDLSFGRIQKPSLLSKVKVDSSGVISTVDGDAIAIPGGSTPTAGSYLITGDGSGGNTINISVSDAGGEAGFVLSDFRGSYGAKVFNNAGTDLPAPGITGTNLTFGATLAIPSNATAGIKHPKYDIAVNYQ